MPFLIVRNDLTRMKVDAIVNAANPSLLGGGGVDGAIHRAAGPELLEECRTLGGCRPGEVKLTRGYHLPASWVIHTVGPVWQGGYGGEEAVLTMCYRNALELAQRRGFSSVAFPLISSGVYGYPVDQALHVACRTIEAVLREGAELTVYLVVFNREATVLIRNRLPELRTFIDDQYVDACESRYRRECRPNPRVSASFPPAPCAPAAASPRPKEEPKKAPPPPAPQTMTASLWGMPEQSLEEYVQEVDESFSQMLLRKIDESGMTDAQCYHKANIDRKLFSKIRSDPDYRPSKPTVLAFAIALELSLDETRQMLGRAGFALSHSSRFDLIIEYFLARGVYDIFQINEALFAFDQNLLGA